MEIIEKLMERYGVSRFPAETAYAMAYVPFQQNCDKMYSAMQGYECGTMFENLNKPFCPAECEGFR